MAKIIPTTYHKLQQLAKRANVAPSFLVSKEHDFRDTFIRYVIEHAQNYVYIYSRNSEHIDTSTLHSYLSSRKKPITVQMLVQRQNIVELPKTGIDIEIFQITPAQIKQKHDSLNFIIADDKVMAIEISEKDEEWMASFSSSKTVAVMKKFFLMHTQRL